MYIVLFWGFCVHRSLLMYLGLFCHLLVSFNVYWSFLRVFLVYLDLFWHIYRIISATNRSISATNRFWSRYTFRFMTRQMFKKKSMHTKKTLRKDLYTLKETNKWQKRPMYTKKDLYTPTRPSEKTFTHWKGPMHIKINLLTHRLKNDINLKQPKKRDLQKRLTNEISLGSLFCKSLFFGFLDWYLLMCLGLFWCKYLFWGSFWCI